MAVTSSITSPRALIAWTVGLVTLAVAGAAALFAARAALLLIYVSVLLAIGFAPLTRAIERQRIVPVGTRLPRWLAILVIYVAILGLVIVLALLVVPPLIDQARQFWDELPRFFYRAQRWMVDRGWIHHQLTLREAMERTPGDPARAALGTVAAALGTIASGALGTVTVLVLTFYLLVESDSLFRAFARIFPADRRPAVLRASREVSDKVSAWLVGQMILAGTIGGSSAVGLYVIGVPYFYVLAVISAVGEVIPVVGPILAAIPAITVALTVSPQTAIAVLIFFLVQQQAENHLLVPRIMGSQVGVSPVTVIVALLIGGSAFGVAGAVLAVPTAAILQVIVQEILDERDRDKATAAQTAQGPVRPALDRIHAGEA